MLRSVHRPSQPVCGKIHESIELQASEPWHTVSRIWRAILVSSEEQNTERDVESGGSAHEVSERNKVSAETWVRSY